jgi:hypothetical protein
MLERAEYAMQSMEDGRRLIRNHGWAVLVVGSSGGLRAAHVPCLLDPVHDPGGASQQLVIIGHTGVGQQRTRQPHATTPLASTASHPTAARRLASGSSAQHCLVAPVGPGSSPVVHDPPSSPRARARSRSTTRPVAAAPHARVSAFDPPGQHS